MAKANKEGWIRHRGGNQPVSRDIAHQGQDEAYIYNNTQPRAVFTIG